MNDARCLSRMDFCLALPALAMMESFVFGWWRRAFLQSKPRHQLDAFALSPTTFR